MHPPRQTSAKGDRGVAYVLALLLLALFCTIAVAIASTADLDLRKSDNCRNAQAVQLAVESGLAFFAHELTNCDVNGSLRGQALLDALATRLKTDLDGTPNLKGATVAYDSHTIAVPEIAIDAGKSFSAELAAPSSDAVRLHVTGHLASGAGLSKVTLTRKISMDFNPVGNPAFGYAFCSMGPIKLEMNAEIIGSTYASEASLYSGASGTAISVGTGEINGDVCTSDPGASVSLGSTHVGGAVCSGASPVTMPKVDPSVYAAAVPAWTIVSSATPSGGTFTNIRIKANTNPYFGSDITVRGVMYVEAPNNVQFGNNVSVTGAIIADDPPSGSPDSANQIRFMNNASFHGMEELPDEAAFTQLRNLAGTSVLAPGFSMEFNNNFTAAAGTVAVKSLVAKNNVSCELSGNILIYGSGGLTFKNNAVITVDRSKCTGAPPGFEGSGQTQLRANPGSYVERQ